MADSLKESKNLVKRFLQSESFGGIILLGATLLALIFANTPWAGSWQHFWETPRSFGLTRFHPSLAHIINDGLMTIFFFVMGIEIKHAVTADRRTAILPSFAALGGMIVPAVLYTSMMRGQEGEGAWGIPVATDIAFVVGLLSLLGQRVPAGLKILVLSLAIVDDLGAILVIATAYSSNINYMALAIGAMGLGVTALLSSVKNNSTILYLSVGILIWLAFLMSGVHPTIAGVLIAFVAPLDYLEKPLKPFVSLIIVPLFALANAGVSMDIHSLLAPVSMAVTLGLLVGKPLGIALFCYLAVKFGGAQLPTNVTWKMIGGAGILSGVGFTMSIFIANLGLSADLLPAGKMGTFLGSTLSAVLGLWVLHSVLPRLKSVS